MVRLFVPVFGKHHSNRRHLASPYGTADNGAITIRLHKGGPAAMLDHVAYRFHVTIVGGPVENAKVIFLIVI